jgi:hypothetical protein
MRSLDLFGAKGGDDENGAGGLLFLLVCEPPAQELHRQLVGPLAVVEQDDGRAEGGSHRVQEGREGRNASRLAVQLGTERCG